MKYKILATFYKFCTCPRTSKLKFSTCPEWNGTRSDKSGMVFPQPCCSGTGHPSRDLEQQGMVSKALVKVCRCFHTCWLTRFYNYASGWSLHVTLAVNKTLEISQVGHPSVANKQNNWVSNKKAGHKLGNLVKVGGFFCRQDLSIFIFGRT